MKIYQEMSTDLFKVSVAIHPANMI